MGHSCTITERDGVHITGPTGRLDSSNSIALEKILLELLDTRAPCALLDCAALECVFSAGLRVVLMAAKRARAIQGRQVLCALRAPVREVFEICGFLQILDVQPDEAAGLARLAPA